MYSLELQMLKNWLWRLKISAWNRWQLKKTALVSTSRKPNIVLPEGKASNIFINY